MQFSWCILSLRPMPFDRTSFPSPFFVKNTKLHFSLFFFPKILYNKRQLIVVKGNLSP